MQNKQIVIVPAHVTDKRQLLGLQNCIKSIRTNSNRPILLAFSGDINLVKDELSNVDEYVFTSTNTIITLDSPLTIFYETPNWKITYTFPLPRKYHGYAHMQKVSLALKAAKSLNYEHFLVVNYDSIVMDKGFIDYMFSSDVSVFFKYRDTTFTNMDVFKLSLEGADIIESLGEYNTYKKCSQNVTAEMIENAATELLKEAKIPVRVFNAENGTAFQLKPFNVLINSISSGDAMAAVVDNKICMLVTSQGSPMHSLDGKLEIGYKGVFTTFDVSSPFAMLHTITEYTGEDIEISVRSSFGEFPFLIRKNVLENTVFEWK